MRVCLNFAQKNDLSSASATQDISSYLAQISSWEIEGKHTFDQISTSICYQGTLQNCQPLNSNFFAHICILQNEIRVIF